MCARVLTSWLVTFGVFASSAAMAEQKSTKVDLKAIRDELVVLQDSEGGTYVVKPYKLGDSNTPSAAPRIFFGTAGKELYEQTNGGRGADGSSWSQSTWAPRLPNMQMATLALKKDGSYVKSCGKEDLPLTQLTGDKAKAVLDRSTFMTEFLVRRAHLLARDDNGVYYFVDRFSSKYGGKGFRVFVGKKGAMKQLALTDVASDSAGEVFATKTGDLRLTRTNTAEGGSAATWSKGEKRVQLIPLDVDVNSVVIFSDLGIYKFIGTLCDNI